jgi:predicted alpha/beta hydrolase family esterase
MRKKQVVFIPGGESFASNEEFLEFLRSTDFDPYRESARKWREHLQEEIEVVGGEYLFLEMPNRLNAQYAAWVICFEKLMPYLHDGMVLIGHSLGGGFLVRYLSTNTLPVAVSQLHLVAPAISEENCPGMGEFDTNLNTFTSWQGQVNQTHVWYSDDDQIVPAIESKQLLEKLSTAIPHQFSDRGHFLMEEFPEIEEIILQT